MSSQSALQRGTAPRQKMPTQSLGGTEIHYCVGALARHRLPRAFQTLPNEVPRGACRAQVACTYASQQSLTNTTKASAIKAYADEFLPHVRNIRRAPLEASADQKAAPKSVNFVLPIAD